MALIGYARVSTEDQNTNSQTDALNAAGCVRIFTEHASGAKWQRVELHRMLDHLRQGDTLVVFKLDRLSRSLRDLLTLLDTLNTKGVFFRSLSEGFDTDTAAGRMTIQILGAVGEFERAMIGERTKAGLAAAKARGVQLGRRSALSPAQAEEARAMLQVGRTQADVARVVGCHPSTISRLLAQARKNVSAKPGEPVQVEEKPRISVELRQAGSKRWEVESTHLGRTDSVLFTVTGTAQHPGPTLYKRWLQAYRELRGSGPVRAVGRAVRVVATGPAKPLNTALETPTSR